MDQVLFGLVHLLLIVGQADQARVYFDRLCKDYPQSAYLPHAYLTYGEYFFELHDFQGALKSYNTALQFTDSPSSLHGYAIYKKGWAYLNLRDVKAAIALFIDAINFADDPKHQQTGSARQLGQFTKEARKALVCSYAQLGTQQGH